MVEVENKSSSPGGPKTGTGQTGTTSGSTSNLNPPKDGASAGSPSSPSPSGNKLSLPSNSPGNPEKTPTSSPDKPSVSSPSTKPSSPPSPPINSAPTKSAPDSSLHQPSDNRGPAEAGKSGGAPGSTQSFPSSAPPGVDRQNGQSGTTSSDKPADGTDSEPSHTGVSLSSQPSAPPPFGNPKGTGLSPTGPPQSSPAKENGPSPSTREFGSSTKTDNLASPTSTPHGPDPGSSNFPDGPSKDPFDSSPSKSAFQPGSSSLASSSGRLPGTSTAELSSSRQGPFGSTPTLSNLPSSTNGGPDKGPFGQPSSPLHSAQPGSSHDLPFKQQPPPTNEPTLTSPSISLPSSSSMFPEKPSFSPELPPSQSKTDKSAPSSPAGTPSLTNRPTETSTGLGNPFRGTDNPFGPPNEPADPKPSPSQSPPFGQSPQLPNKPTSTSKFPFTSSSVESSPKPSFAPQFPPFHSTEKPVPSSPAGKSSPTNRPSQPSTTELNGPILGTPAKTSLPAISVSVGLPNKSNDPKPNPSQNSSFFPQSSAKPTATTTFTPVFSPSIPPDHPDRPPNQPGPSQDQPPQAPPKSSQSKGGGNIPAPSPTNVDHGPVNSNAPSFGPSAAPQTSSAIGSGHLAQNPPDPDPSLGQSRPSNRPQPSLPSPRPVQSSPRPTPNPAPTSQQSKSQPSKSPVGGNEPGQNINPNENSSTGSSLIAASTSFDLFPTSAPHSSAPVVLAATQPSNPNAESTAESDIKGGTMSLLASSRLTTITSVTHPPPTVVPTTVPVTVTSEGASGPTVVTLSVLTHTTITPPPSSSVFVTQVPISNASKGNHTKAIVGAFVGAVVAALILAAITFLLIRRRYRRKPIRLQEEMGFTGEGGGVSIPPPSEPTGGFFTSSDTPYTPVSISEEHVDEERRTSESRPGAESEYRSVLVRSPSMDSIRGSLSNIARLSPGPQLLHGNPFEDRLHVEESEDGHSILSGFNSSFGHSSAASIRSSRSVRSNRSGASTIRVKRTFRNFTASSSYENDPFSDQSTGPPLIDHPIPVAASSAEFVYNPFDDELQDNTPRRESSDTVKKMTSRLSAGSGITGSTYEPSEDGTIGCAL